MSGLYEDDVLEWSEHQARLLRLYAQGRPGNESPDWTNIIEEVESVGRSQLSAVRSLLIQAMAHDLKSEAWPESREVAGWRAEARRFRLDAAEAYTPSMRQRIDAGDLYRKARSILPANIDGQAPGPVRGECPSTLDELLGN